MSAEQRMAADVKENVESLGDMQKKSDNRQQVATGVVDCLESELAAFTEFIDNIAERRPSCTSFITHKP